MNRAIMMFLAVTFGFSWTVSELYFRFMPQSSIGYVLIGVLYMYGPALGAVCALRFGSHQPLSTLGPLWRWHKFLLLALMLPIVIASASMLMSALLPGITLNTTAAEVLAKTLSLAPAEKQAMLTAQLNSMGQWMPLIILFSIAFSAMLAGATINALAAFGEELGWRGFLQRQWAHKGFWSSSFMVGAVWGLWHLPLILRGHNYPEHPQAGAFMMIVFAILIAPLFNWILQRTNTLLAPIFMHGALNATGGVLVFVTGGNDLLVGPTGLAGFLVLALFNALLWWYLRSAQSQLSLQETYAPAL